MKLVLQPGDGGCELHLELCSLKLSEVPCMEILIGCQCMCPTGDDCKSTKSVSPIPLELFVRDLLVWGISKHKKPQLCSDRHTQVKTVSKSSYVRHDHVPLCCSTC